MIDRFGDETALLLIDVQRGVEHLEHWGGPTGRRNNPDADDHLRRLLDGWRRHGRQVVLTVHDSREAASPLKSHLESGRLKEGFEPADGDEVVGKSTNGAFFGTDLELRLRRRAITRLVIAGYFTNMCVETTVRSAGNLGYDTYLCPDACATTNRVGLDGVDHDAEVVHALSVASMHGEFCTALDTDAALGLLEASNAELERMQGNEP